MNIVQTIYSMKFITPFNISKLQVYVTVKYKCKIERCFLEQHKPHELTVLLGNKSKMNKIAIKGKVKAIYTVSTKKRPP